MIAWTIEQAKSSKYIDNIIVSTDDEKIMEIATSLNVDIIKRPKNISGDNATSESALLHAMDSFKKKNNFKLDAIVFLQATSPLRKKDDIDDAIDYFFSSKADSLFSATSPDDLTLWNNENGIWESINFDYKNRTRRQDMKKNYIENGSIYIFKPDVLKNYNNRLGKKISVYKMDFWQTWEIDTIDEVDLVEFYIKKKKLDKNGIN